VVVALDGAQIRAIPGFQVRHFEVTAGRVEGGAARHFAVAPSVTTPRPRAIANALRARGWLPGREVTALSDGDPALVESMRSAACAPNPQANCAFNHPNKLLLLMLVSGSVCTRLHSPIDHRAPLAGYDAAANLVGDLLLGHRRQLIEARDDRHAILLLLRVGPTISQYSPMLRQSATLEEIASALSGKKNGSTVHSPLPPNLSGRLIFSQSDKDSVTQQGLGIQ
jgi:hypothetical protein